MTAEVHPLRRFAFKFDWLVLSYLPFTWSGKVRNLRRIRLGMTEREREGEQILLKIEQRNAQLKQRLYELERWLEDTDKSLEEARRHDDCG